MDLATQIRQRLNRAFLGANAPLCSAAQFDALVQMVVAIVKDAEDGELADDRYQHGHIRGVVPTSDGCPIFKNGVLMVDVQLRDGQVVRERVDQYRARLDPAYSIVTRRINEQVVFVRGPRQSIAEMSHAVTEPV